MPRYVMLYRFTDQGRKNINPVLRDLPVAARPRPHGAGALVFAREPNGKAE